jgi:hypothetical protein
LPESTNASQRRNGSIAQRVGTAAWAPLRRLRGGRRTEAPGVVTGGRTGSTRTSVSGRTAAPMGPPRNLAGPIPAPSREFRPRRAQSVRRPADARRRRRPSIDGQAAADPFSPSAATVRRPRPPSSGEP